MTTNDRIERLLQLMDQPENFTEAEARELLADEDNRDLYRLLADVSRAYDTPAPADTEQALAQFEASQSVPAARLWRKLAAAVVGLLVVSGLAFAAISMGGRQGSRELAQAETPAVSSPAADTAREVSPLQAAPAPVRVFDDVALSDLLSELAAHYRLSVVYAPAARRNLRLHFSWDRQAPVETVVAALNHFEKVQLKLNHDTLTVE